MHAVQARYAPIIVGRIKRAIHASKTAMSSMSGTYRLLCRRPVAQPLQRLGDTVVAERLLSAYRFSSDWLRHEVDAGQAAASAYGAPLLDLLVVMVFLRNAVGVHRDVDKLRGQAGPTGLLT